MTEHRTIVLGRTFEAPIERVYAALTEPLERARMGTADDQYAFILDETDVRVGGRDSFRFGPKGNPWLGGHSVYQVIVPPRLIVATEVVEADGGLVSVSLSTLALSERGAETEVRLTVQLLSLGDDEGLSDAAGARHPALLECLARHLGTPGRPRQRPLSRR